MKCRGVAILLIAPILSVSGGQRGSLVQRVPADAKAKTNPFAGNREASLAGAKLFARECSGCHGQNATGGKAPPLKSREVADALPGTLFWILRNGSLRRGMPSFAHLPEPERWQIVTYLETIQRTSFVGSQGQDGPRKKR